MPILINGLPVYTLSNKENGLLSKEYIHVKGLKDLLPEQCVLINAK
jgi:hypothetical protein